MCYRPLYLRGRGRVLRVCNYPMPSALAAPALTTAALALAAALAPPAALASAFATAHHLAILLQSNRPAVGGWASSVPVSRRRSRKHPQRRGERRCVGSHPSIHHRLDRCD